MEEVLNKATWLDAIVATSDVDSQNEVLKLDGADISRMTQHGVFNDNHATGMANTLGKITHAKKIFSKKDCDNERHMYYWNQMQRPFIYAAGFLFDDAGHPAAKATAAIIKEFENQNMPLQMKASVEGKVIKRNTFDKSLLENSIIQNVALTLTPANKNTGVSILNDKIYNNVITKCNAISPEVAKQADSLMKNMGVEPFDTIGCGGKCEIIPPSILNKGLFAGYGAGTTKPSELTGGAVLVPQAANKKVKKVAPDMVKKVLIQSLIEKMLKNQKESGLSYDRIVELATHVVNKSST